MAAEDSGLDGQRAMAPILRERWGRAWGRGEDSPGWRYGFREKRSALIFSFIFPQLERFYRDTCGMIFDVLLLPL
ncbi:hypothetical protein ACFX2B_004083 [Malus domestica]